MSATQGTPVVLTKEEKIAKIEKQIAALTQRLDDVRNDRVPQKASAKAVYVPAVGDAVLATVGRNTATSQAKVVEGTVIAVKMPEIGEDGKAKGATQVRVRVGSGFDEQVVTLYPAQLTKVVAEEAAAE